MTNITGYRTNTDHTQTLAWEERADGTVICDHQPERACLDCLEADERLGAFVGGVRVVNWPAYMQREGRTVRFVRLG